MSTYFWYFLILAIWAILLVIITSWLDEELEKREQDQYESWLKRTKQ